MSDINQICIVNNIDCFDITYIFKQGNNYNICITVPHNLTEDDFIIFVLGTLSKTKLKILREINLKLINGKNTDFKYVFNNNRNGIYYFDTDLINDDDTLKWSLLKKKLFNEYKSQNQDSLNAVITINSINNKDDFTVSASNNFITPDDASSMIDFMISCGMYDQKTFSNLAQFANIESVMKIANCYREVKHYEFMEQFYLIAIKRGHFDASVLLDNYYKNIKKN